MRVISVTHLRKTATLPANIVPQLTIKEEQIFSFINRACEAIPTLSEGKYGVPTARVAGGWVRDKLMPFVRNDVQVKPPKDLDITIDIMDGGKFGEFLRLYDKVSGENAFTFGTDRGETANRIAVCFCRIYDEEVEFLQLRKESYNKEGDRQSIEVEAGSLSEDTYRRDLTINAMYYNIRTGRVEDVTGQGYDDLATLTLRTPCKPGADPRQEVDRIFSEDPIRVLRVLRFNSRWPNARIAPETLDGMRSPKIQELLTRKMWDKSLSPDDAGVAPEKTAEELKKIMAGEQPEESIRLMFETGVLQKILGFPKTFQQFTMNQMNKHHDMTVLHHTLQVIKNVNNLSIEFGLTPAQRVHMNLSALLHDVGKLDPRSHFVKPDGTRGYMGDPNNPDSITHQQSSADHWELLARALKMSDEDRIAVHDLVLNHMNPHAHVEIDKDTIPSDKQLRKYLRKNPSWVFQYIHAMADAMSKSENPNPAAADPYRTNLERLRMLAPNADDSGNMPPAQDLLNGKEIIQIVGLPPKPPAGLIGYIEVVKERIRDEQDANPAMTKDDAIMVVQNMISSGELDAYRQV